LIVVTVVLFHVVGYVTVVFVVTHFVVAFVFSSSTFRSVCITCCLLFVDYPVTRYLPSLVPCCTLTFYDFVTLFFYIVCCVYCCSTLRFVALTFTEPVPLLLDFRSFVTLFVVLRCHWFC